MSEQLDKNRIVVVELVFTAEWGPKPAIRCMDCGHSTNWGRPHCELIILDCLSHDEWRFCICVPVAWRPPFGLTGLRAGWYSLAVVMVVRKIVANRTQFSWRQQIVDCICSCFSCLKLILQTTAETRIEKSGSGTAGGSNWWRNCWHLKAGVWCRCRGRLETCRLD